MDPIDIIIQKHGGQIVNREQDADILLIDHMKMDAPGTCVHSGAHGFGNCPPNNMFAVSHTNLLSDLSSTGDLRIWRITVPVLQSAAHVRLGPQQGEQRLIEIHFLRKMTRF
jgi:hypothetical protein